MANVSLPGGTYNIKHPSGIKNKVVTLKGDVAIIDVEYDNGITLSTRMEGDKISVETNASVVLDQTTNEITLVV